METGLVVTISPVRCAVLALFNLEYDISDRRLARWVGSPAYGWLEVKLV